MADFPLPLAEMFGHWGSYGVYLLIGVAFGVILEVAGFGNSMKLAAQFYFRDLTVFKVMFTAIIVAAVLIFFASGLGLLDYNLIWVPPTYLWPGIVGGLIMGAGFIVGGFCPGTSLVAMATGKIDGIVFVFGVLFGIFMFGETVSSFDVFFESSYMGRFTLPELFDTTYGLVVLVIVVGALLMFWGAEMIEAAMNNEANRKAPRWQIASAGALTVIAAAVLLVGQPQNEDRWAVIAAEKQGQLDRREVQIEPNELLSLIHDSKIKAIPIDVRNESSFNQFHIQRAQHVPLEDVVAEAKAMQFEAGNTVFVVMSNDETGAEDAWKKLKAESVQNLYILEGGVNNWLDTYASDFFRQARRIAEPEDDQLSYRFPAAIGSRHPAAEPNFYGTEIEFTPKVKLEIKRAPVSGGCG